MKMQSILSYTYDEFEKEILASGIPKYRAGQIFQWVFEKGARSFDEMTNLSVDLRKQLSERFSFPKFEHEVFVSTDGTQKFRFALSDGKTIESVWMPEERRNTLCISSQVGCAMKCAFCVTGAVGFKRNLSPEEIAAQVWFVKSVLKLPLSNVVYMGMGEPLANMEAVIRSLDLVTDKRGLAVGKRRITVSTVGLAPKIKEFFDKTDVKLAISLTGTNDADRDHWMPINKTYDLTRLTQELRHIRLAPGRLFTFEVVMLRGETDGERQAKELARVLQGIPSKVNLIPYNENPYFPDLKTPDPEKIERFRDILMAAGIHAMIRRNRGVDIMGACGQLAGEN